MMHLAQLYAMKLANKLTKITMEKFFKHVHSTYYPDQDISFMEYFLELTQHEGEFVVPHSKLLDFGIMTSTRSSVILEKLQQLELENGQDFNLQDILQVRQNRGQVISKQYTLTPEAFKLSLMSARNYPGQTVNPIVYRKYYLLLEKVFKLYTDYERQYSKCLLAIKDDKIDTLTEKVDQQSLQIQEMLANSRHIINQNGQLSTQVSDLHTEVTELHSEVTELNIKIDALFEFMLSFARMTIPTWIGSSIIKQQYDTLSINKDSAYAMKHLKILFMVGFYIQEDEPIMQTKVVNDQPINFRGRGYLKIYNCCTNFADIRARIKLLYERHSNGGVHTIMFMLKPTVVTLISCEINSERIILENASQIFPDRSVVTWDGKYKSFDLIIDTAHYNKANKIFGTICEKATSLRFQDYQQRVDKFDATVEIKLDPKIIDYIDEVDKQFFSATKPFCQQFINSYSHRSIDEETNNLVEYKYGVSNLKCKPRLDLAGVNLTANAYSLRKIELLIEEHTSLDHIQHMIDTGILSKEDLPALRAIAKFENIDVSALVDEYGSDIEDY